MRPQRIDVESSGNLLYSSFARESTVIDIASHLKVAGHACRYGGFFLLMVVGEVPLCINSGVEHVSCPKGLN